VASEADDAQSLRRVKEEKKRERRRKGRSRKRTFCSSRKCVLKPVGSA
jgi:hypothetical protein